MHLTVARLEDLAHFSGKAAIYSCSYSTLLSHDVASHMWRAGGSCRCLRACMWRYSNTMVSRNLRSTHHTRQASVECVTSNSFSHNRTSCVVCIRLQPCSLGQRSVEHSFGHNTAGNLGVHMPDAYPQLSIGFVDGNRSIAFAERSTGGHNPAGFLVPAPVQAHEAAMQRRAMGLRTTAVAPTTALLQTLEGAPAILSPHSTKVEPYCAACEIPHCLCWAAGLLYEVSAEVVGGHEEVSFALVMSHVMISQHCTRPQGPLTLSQRDAHYLTWV
eukprot:1832109-Amphidinium_carterae.1